MYFRLRTDTLVEGALAYWRGEASSWVDPIAMNVVEFRAYDQTNNILFSYPQNASVLPDFTVLQQEPKWVLWSFTVPSGVFPHVTGTFRVEADFLVDYLPESVFNGTLLLENEGMRRQKILGRI
eukprot:GABV01009597.1.p1 GENE.GABV01009597.1~~GABV01009597.1.p1  ORF type:complete len:124 (+),score=20.30 GABV01009597.1:160-531(+)